MSVRLQDLSDAGQWLRTAGINFHQSRATSIPDDRLPAVLGYAPDEEGDPLGGSHPHFRVSATLEFEGRVAASDGWDTAAAALTERILQTLYGDPEWLARWKHPPRYRVRQYIDDKGRRPVCGEVLTITGERQQPREIRPRAPALKALDSRRA